MGLVMEKKLKIKKKHVSQDHLISSQLNHHKPFLVKAPFDMQADETSPCKIQKASLLSHNSQLTSI